MENDRKFLKEIEQFERFFAEVFKVNDQPHKPLPKAEDLVLDGPAQSFGELPFFRFTRRSKERQKELGETGEYKAYCTPGDAKILKEDMGYKQFLDALKKVEFAGFKDLQSDAVNKLSTVKPPEYFIPAHPDYKSDDFDYVWRRAQRCCPYIIDSVYGKMRLPAPMYTAYLAATLSLSQQGYDVIGINVYRALLREAKIAALRATHIKDIVQLYAEQNLDPAFDVNHPEGYEQYPDGNLRQTARNLFEFIECIGDGHMADFRVSDVKKYEVWWTRHRTLENQKQRHKKRKNKKDTTKHES
jgi:hypothetical protein